MKQDGSQMTTRGLGNQASKPHAVRKGKTTMTPTTTNKIPVQKTVFDLDLFDEVTLVKDYEFTPVTSVQEATERLGNDSAKILSVINDGLRAEMRRIAVADQTGWLREDEDGNRTPFAGTLANLKLVNQCVLSMAKTVFGFSKDLSPDAKRAAKQSAQDLIKNTPAIREGLQKTAANAGTEQE